MFFAPISPIAYLERYSGRSHVQMCVGCWAIKYPEYFEWYRRRREAGDFVFLDNGAYEGELVSNEEYIRLIQELKPNVYAIPDKINDEAETERMCLDFFRGLKFAVPSEPMRVLQSEERELPKWLDMFRKIQNMYKWVAFPRALKEHRVRIVRLCMCQKHMETRVHAFGWTGSVEEVNKLARLGVDTMDSAGPVWRGLLGYGIGATWVDSKFDPTFSLPTHECDVIYPEIADSNLSEVLRAAVGL